MSLKVVLLTKPWQPEAAQLLWRLLRLGNEVFVIVENRRRSFLRFCSLSGVFRYLCRLGIRRAWGMFARAIQIRKSFLMRKFFRKFYRNPVFWSVEEIMLHTSFRKHLKDANRDDDAVRSELNEFKPDAVFVVKTRRPSTRFLNSVQCGFYGIHLGDLEKYPGADPVFWALAAGESRIGVTFFRFASVPVLDEIIFERSLSVFPFDEPASLADKARWYATYLAEHFLKEMETGGHESRRPLARRSTFSSYPSRKSRREFYARWKKKKKVFRPPEGQVRVLHIITRMVRGGAQKNTLATVEGLVQKGYAVTLVTGPSWGTEDEILHEALEADLEVMILPELVRDIQPLTDFRALQKLIQFMRWYAFSIVHTHTSKAGLLGRLAAARAKIPIVIHTPHGHIFHSYFSPIVEKVFLGCERRIARQTHRFVALTSQCRDEHLALQVGALDQWTVIPSGVEEKNIEDLSAVRNEILDSLGIPRERKMIGFIGRLAPVKGCAYLLRALPLVYWAKFNFHCLVVGDGEQRSDLESIVGGTGLKSRVTFVGYQKDISRFLSVFDILVVPSLNEGMGRVIVEAGFLSKAVIASDVGGIPDLIENGVTGLLVAPRDPDVIAGAVIHLLQEPRKAEQLGKNLHKKVLAGFTESQMVEKIHSLYQELLGGNSGGHLESLPALSEAASSK